MISVTQQRFRVRLGGVFNQPLAAGTNVFQQDLTVKYTGYVLVTMVNDNNSIGYFIYNGTPVQVNSGTALSGGAGYTFKIPVQAGDKINVQFATTGTVSVYVDNTTE